MHVAIDAQAARDLAADSALMKLLAKTPLPDMVELTAIGAADDFMVAGGTPTRTGIRGTTVLPGGINAHTSILEDPGALRVVRSALERRAMPCQSLMTSVIGTVLPIAIAAFEEHAGTAAAAVGRLAQGGM